MNHNDWHLVLVDADRIQEYVLGSRELKMIRGASAIQRDLNFEYLPRLLLSGEYGVGNLAKDETGRLVALDQKLEDHPNHTWEAIYMAGGNLMALFRSQTDANRYVACAEAEFQKRSAIASATGVVVRWTGSLGPARELAYEQLAIRKSARAMHANPVSCVYGKHCEACGLALASSREGEGKKRFLCSGCQIRREAAERWPYLKMVGTSLTGPNDFDALSQGSRPAHYLALISIDVDRLGVYFENLGGDRSEFREASQNVVRQTEGAIIQACRKITGEPDGDTKVPFEILWLGGDDAVVMVQAHLALRFLKEAADKFKVPGLTFSAGIVWANRSFPIAQFVERAKELLQSAKSQGGGRVDTLVVSEALARSLRDQRRRTLKPYKLDDYARLGEAVSSWRREGMPSNKVKQLYQIAYEEPTQAEIDYLFLLSRLPVTQRKRMLDEIDDFWQGPGKTKAADLSELWEFVV